MFMSANYCDNITPVDLCTWCLYHNQEALVAALAGLTINQQVPLKWNQIPFVLFPHVG